jgi:hypothetical protein
LQYGPEKEGGNYPTGIAEPDEMIGTLVNTYFNFIEVKVQ